MNCSNLLSAFMRLNFMYNLPWVHVPPTLIKTLGHRVITTPTVLAILNRIDIPYILADYGDIVEDEITGAILAGEDGFMQEQVAIMTSQSGWKARAMVVVITINPHQKHFHYLWKEQVMNVVLITRKGSFAYNPFNDTMFSVDGLDVTKVLAERWRDLQGYRVAVAMYRHNLSFRTELGISLGSGIDGSAIYELVKYWNMTVDIVDTGQYNHSVQISDRMLNNGQVDLSMNARFLSREKKFIEKPEYTTSVYTDSVVIVMKIPDKLRGWVLFGKIFKWTVWLGLLGGLILMNRAILWMGKVTNWSNSFWTTLKALCNVPLSRPPRSTPDRLVVATAFLVGMVMLTLFQASLYHFIKEGVTYKRVKIIPQVISKIPLVTDSEIIKDIFRSYDTGTRKVKLDLKIMPLNNEVFEKHAFVTRTWEIKLLIETGELRSDLYIVDEKVGNIPLSYVVKRGSPYLQRLSDFTSRAFEGGLWSIWYRMTLRRLSRGKKPIEKEQDFKVLTLRDVEVAFFALIIGHLTSIIAFLLELLTKAIHQGKMRKLRRYIIIFCNFMYPTK
ncbi:Ionotropic receptor 105 [Halyomorpha halys]|nr:Ionotropic receptor 105 [Halyomorpha halys]